MPAGRLDANGRLVDMTWRDPAAGDVPLKAMPSGMGPWTYDAATQMASPAPLTREEAAARLRLSPKFLTALVLKLSSSSGVNESPTENAAIQAILDDEAARVTEAGATYEPSDLAGPQSGCMPALPDRVKKRVGTNMDQDGQDDASEEMTQ